jgi:hypothetical protein
VTPFVSINEKYGTAANTLQYSYLGGYSDVMKASTWPPSLDSSSGTIRTKAINVSLRQLYSVAFAQELYRRQSYPLTSSQFLLDSFINKKFEPDFSTNENLFCYDQIFKDSIIDKAQVKMRSDLDNYFSVQSNLQKKEIKCVVIKRMAGSELWKAVEGAETSVNFNKDTIYYSNITWGHLLSDLNERTDITGYKVIDETGISEYQKVSVKFAYGSFSKISNSLKKFDLDIFFDERILDVIILRKAN